MSNRYKGGVISATPPTLVAGAGASGTWTLEQQMQANAAGLWPVNGPFYIEDVFSTYLYTGNGTSQTITNGVDLSTKGGLVWVKSRSSALNHLLVDTARGANRTLASNTTAAQIIEGGVTAFNTTGFDIDNIDRVNTSSATYASWTFRKQPKFFDIVTYTGDGNNNRLISHNLGSTPGCVIVKCTSHADTWAVWHRSLTSTQYSMALNTTAAQGNAQANQSFSFDGSVSMSSTQFVVSQEAGYANSSDKTYVAYLFAHNAGGFGLTGTDNVISCGSYTGNGSSTTIDLGYEPQWLLIKSSSSSSYNWVILDNMRGLSGGSNGTPRLYPNTSGAEAAGNELGSLNATGFTVSGGNSNANGVTYIYIAIRRGPMKVPTSGTSVFTPVTYTGNGATTRVVSTTITPDAGWFFHRDNANGEYWFDRLRGGGNWLQPSTTGSESSWTGAWLFDVQNAVQMKSAGANYINGSGALNGLWALKRAPSFFDVVCYTGNNVNSRVLTHNLGVAPELVIIKSRTAAFFSGWSVTTSALPVVGGLYQEALLNATGGFNGGGFRVNIPSTGLTATTVTLGTDYSYGNESPNTYVMYLFASCPGVSKVGSYTGTGTTKQIDCGFTGGARFVLIKRTDSTGDWYVWDSARGIVAGNDPYLLLNSADAEVTNTDYVDTYSAGFEISSTAPAAINASGGTFIFLAIA